MRQLFSMRLAFIMSAISESEIVLHKGWELKTNEYKVIKLLMIEKHKMKYDYLIFGAILS